MANASRREVGRRLWRQLPLLVALVLLWLILWGTLSWLSIISGVIVAYTVTRVFYLPPVDLSGRFNLWHIAVYLAHFAKDVVFASFQVAFQAITPGVPRSSIIAIQLRTRSDLIMTLVGITLSLIPGSLVVDVDRERSILYLHTFNTESDEDVESTRGQALVIEGRIVRALGSREDLRRVRLGEEKRAEYADNEGATS